jgi:alpha-tubulin suppressor-like RCC1 family protein
VIIDDDFSAMPKPKLVGGVGHACALLAGGIVKCWGHEAFGQTGQGTSHIGDGPGEMGDSLTSVNFGTGRTAKGISTASRACALLDNDTVKCWGPTMIANLGVGDIFGRGSRPGEMGDSLPAINLGTGRTAKSVSVGFGHVCAILNDDTVKCWGTNSFGGLGYGDTTTRGQTAGSMGDNLPTVNLGTGRTAKRIYTPASSQGYFTCAILDNNQVKCWGRNNLGQLGQGHTINLGDSAGEMGDNLPYVDLGTGRTALSLALGADSACAILDNGTTKCWGSGFSGQLGLGSTVNLGDAPGEMGDSLPVVSLGTGRAATQLAGGDLHFCAILDNSLVKCWGYGYESGLGNGSSASRGDGPNEMGDNLPYADLGTGRTAISIAAGERSSCAVLDNYSLKCWGRNNFGELGQGHITTLGDGPGEMGDNLPPINLGTGLTISPTASPAISIAYSNVCAILSDSSTRCWGAVIDGLSGRGDSYIGDAAGEMGPNTPAVNLGTGRTALDIAAGDNHTCAILDNQSLKCWGNNQYGQLGQSHRLDLGNNPGEMGDNLPAIALGTGRTAVAITANNATTCAMLDNATVKCWGNNPNGLMGAGHLNNIGDSANEMGDNLPAINLGTQRLVSAVTLGNNHACAILDNSVVKCWGTNSNGQLGLGDIAHRGDTAGEMSDNLPLTQLGTGREARSIHAGSQHTCAILDDATLKCWGLNSSGQLGLGDTLTRGDGPNEMGDNLPAISLGTGRGASGIAAANVHTCALLDNSTAKCWGANSSGQLGAENTIFRGDGPGEMGDALATIAFGTGRTVARMNTGETHSCVVLDNTSVKCWGHNLQGQLGLEDFSHRGDGTNEMGDNLPAVDFD